MCPGHTGTVKTAQVTHFIKGEKIFSPEILWRRNENLIIGGTGLISAAITSSLIERGDTVTLYNRGQSLFSHHPAARIIHGDRTDYPVFEAQMAEAGKFDVVIDMVGYQPEDGESVVRAFSGRVGHFIFCSTVDVYRKPAFRFPISEAEPYGGLNPYSSKKVIIEKRLIEAQHQGAFPLTIIRPAYTYGEGRSPLVPLSGKYFFDRLRRGKPIVVHGDGSSFWTAYHRNDVARVFVNAAYNPIAFGRAYHTNGDEWMTWDVYVRRAAEAIGTPGGGAGLERVQAGVRQRVLGLFERRGLLSSETVAVMQGWGHKGGFSVHAGERVAAQDSAGRERLLRYCARPMFAGERLVWAGDGAQVRYRLPWAALQGHRSGMQGAIELQLSASEFLDRIALLIPPPRKHRHRYFGVLAPNSPWRAQVTAQAGRKLAAGSKPPRLKAADADSGALRSGHPARYLWAQVLVRIYGVFALKCSGCGGRVRLIGFITEPATVRQVLEYVGEPTTAPAIAPARSPPVEVNAQQLIAPEAVEAIPELEFDQTANLAAEGARWKHGCGGRLFAKPRRS